MKNILVLGLIVFGFHSQQATAAGMGTLQLCPRGSCSAEMAGTLNSVLVARLTGAENTNNWQVTLLGVVAGKSTYCYPLKNASFADAQNFSTSLSSASAAGKKLVTRCSTADAIVPTPNGAYLVTPTVFHMEFSAAQ